MQRVLLAPSLRIASSKLFRCFSMTSSTARSRDPNTLSNYDQFLCRHTIANFDIDFKKSQLKGSVNLRLEAIAKSTNNAIVLDTSHLTVKGTKVDGVDAKWDLPPRKDPYGSPLTISLPQQVELGKSVDVEIQVETTDKCTALQWLTPEQTSNKNHPYMFSQCQAIHARSIYPCQDTPAVKSTFEFNLRSPLPVVASGLPTGAKDYKPGENGERGTLLYTFKQETPIPSYLFAIASGDIAFASIGSRSLVATGPEELSGAKWELEDDMEKFMEIAEGILQSVPYAWTQYNVLVLPPSFPYGGMENPVFTFATPTIISGDRENIDVIAHELAHSWSGNLVSNVSWEHFWLNEGWTTYLERRIQAGLHGEPHRSFSAIIGWKALTDSIEFFGEDHEFTKMVVNLKDKDPDDAFSSLPYEKGFVFLYHLENLLGKDKFDSFIPHYFSKFARQSLDSFEFKDTLISFFSSDAETSKKLSDLDWDKWFFSPGYPPRPDYDTSLVDRCYKLVDKWASLTEKDSGAASFEPSPSDTTDWTANQLVVFLERLEVLPTSLTPALSQKLGKVYKLAQSKNAEVNSRYFRVALKAKDETVKLPTADFLGTVGRMKFVRPLFRRLNEFDRDLAVETFEKNKNFYHPICRGMLEQDLFGK